VVRASGGQFARELSAGGIALNYHVLPGAFHAFLNRPHDPSFGDGIRHIIDWALQLSVASPAPRERRFAARTQDGSLRVILTREKRPHRLPGKRYIDDGDRAHPTGRRRGCVPRPPSFLTPDPSALT